MDKVHLLGVVMAVLTILTGIAMLVANLRNLTRDVMIGGGALISLGFAIGWNSDFDKAATAATKLAFWKKAE